MAFFKFNKNTAPQWLKANGSELKYHEGFEWVAISVLGGKTEQLILNLVRLQIPFFHPLLLKNSSSNSKIVACESLWPGYVFCLFNLRTINRERNLKYVQIVLRTADQKVLVQELISTRNTLNAAMGPSSIPTAEQIRSEFQIGELITIRDGPFSGQQAKIDGIRSDGSVAFTLETMRRAIPLIVPAETLSDTFDAQVGTSRYRSNFSLSEFEFVVGKETKSPEDLQSPNKKKPDLKSLIKLDEINQALIEYLQRKPEAIHEMEPRKFEELVAHILQDMGAEIELTPQSKDGGRDILAVFNTPFGETLTIVECKKYDPRRKIGVELVEKFMFTLREKDRANLGLMATTSSFTKGAKAVQKDYDWLLKLNDFQDVCSWVSNYGTWHNLNPGGLWLPR